MVEFEVIDFSVLFEEKWPTKPQVQLMVAMWIPIAWLLDWKNIAVYTHSVKNSQKSQGGCITRCIFGKMWKETEVYKKL